MKNISLNIRTSIMMLIMISIFSFAAKSQNNERVIPILAGTATFNSGKVVVTLEQPISDKNYYVSLTPIGNSPALAIANKGENSFTITGVSGNSVPDGTNVDYIVFLKFKTQVMEHSIPLTTPPIIK
jgi:hypothetical protein